MDVVGKCVKGQDMPRRYDAAKARLEMVVISKGSSHGVSFGGIPPVGI